MTDDKIKDCNTILKRSSKNVSIIFWNNWWILESYEWKNTTSRSKKSDGHVKLLYYSLGKSFEKETKTIEDQNKKQKNIDHNKNR